MGDVVNIRDRHFVQFFTEPVDCDWCGQETHGYVFEGAVVEKIRTPIEEELNDEIPF